MKKIKIYSPYSCLIKQGSSQIEIEPSEYVYLESDLLPIKVYPLKVSSKIYAFEIDSLSSDGRFFRVAEHNGDILIFLLDGLLTENVNIYNFSYLDYNSALEIYPNHLVFVTDSHKKIVYLQNKIEKIEIGNFKFIDYVKFSCGESQTLVCYNVKTNKAKTFVGKEIAITENGFRVESEEDGFYNNMTRSYYIDDDGLKSQNQTYVLSDQKLPDKLISLNFIIHIKNQNFDDALKLLSPNLRKTINSKSLKQYFGKLEYVYMIDSESAFAIKDGNNIIYTFKIKDGKIEEIYDNQ